LANTSFGVNKKEKRRIKVKRETVFLIKIYDILKTAFMSKGKIIVFLAGISVLIPTAYLLFLKLQKPERLVSPVSEAEVPKEEAKTTEVRNNFYEDEAGFSLSYPETLGIVEKDTNDPSFYSSLEFLSKNRPEEKITLKIIDTDVTSIEKYLEKNPQMGKLVSEKEILLSGARGKSFTYREPSRNLVLVIDSGILYRIEAPDSEFWRNALSTIVSSFKLAEGKNLASGGGDTSVIEEEEVVE